MLVVLCVSPAPPDCPVSSGGLQGSWSQVSNACCSLRIRTSAAVGTLQDWGRRGSGPEVAWGRQCLAGPRPCGSREPGPPSCPHLRLSGSAAVPEPRGALCSPGREGAEEECAGSGGARLCEAASVCRPLLVSLRLFHQSLLFVTKPAGSDDALGLSGPGLETALAMLDLGTEGPGRHLWLGSRPLPHP